MSKSVEELRNEIDELDKSIIKYLSKRKKLVIEIAKLKNRSSMKIEDERREKELLKNLCKFAEEKRINKSFVKKIYNVILEDSKDEQKSRICEL